MPVDLIEKSCMRKIYLRLLPFAILSYFLAYIDRINVSFAALTMRGDLGISAGEYGFALGTFYSGDRKSTRLNSSHLGISYAVFCLKKKNKYNDDPH